MESIQIDRIVTFDIQYYYHAAIAGRSEAGGPRIIPDEPATVEIASVSIQGSQLVYNKTLWAELEERILEEEA